MIHFHRWEPFTFNSRRCSINFRIDGAGRHGSPPSRASTGNGIYDRWISLSLANFAPGPSRGAEGKSVYPARCAGRTRRPLKCASIELFVRDRHGCRRIPGPRRTIPSYSAAK